MLERRLENLKQKDIILINDVPVKSELLGNTFRDDDGIVSTEFIPFSAASNISLFTALRTGRVQNYGKIGENPYKGIIKTKIHATYLDYTYYGENNVESNFDFNKEFKKKSQIEDGEIYHKLEHKKDLYVSERLWNELQSLLQEIREVKPKIIIVTGKWGLFFLSGLPGFGETMSTYKDKKPLGALVKYRASLLEIHPCWEMPECILFPIYHTIHSIAMPESIPVMQYDLTKVAYVYNTILEKGISYFKKPEKEITLGISLPVVSSYLENILEILNKRPTFLSVDIETMFHSYIDCIGIAVDKNKGICIPFATIDNPNYWTKEEESKIVLLLNKVLSHPNAKHIGQNYQYDCQYLYKLWGIEVKATHDTMLLHHILYNYLPKDLAFLASVHCEFYTYWKDDINATKESPETRWTYNVKDVLYTLEVLDSLLDILEDENKELKELYRFTMEEIAPETVITMNKGVRIDLEKKEELFLFFTEFMERIRLKINSILGFEFNMNSTPQKKKLFKDFFGMELKLKKRKGQTATETADAQAMLEYVEEYPMLKPFLTLMLEYNAIKVFTRTFLAAKTDEDGRMRTQYRVAGTDTGRLASTKNVWGTGCMPIYEAEAFTFDGWVPISETPEYILQYNENGSLEFVKANWVQYHYNGEMYSYSGRCFRGDFTPDHRIIRSKRGKLNVRTAEQVYGLSGAYDVPVSGELEIENHIVISDNWIQREVMLSADGSKEHKQWRIDVSKQRKKDRILELIPEGKITKSKENYLRVKVKDEGYSKIFPNWLFQCSLEQRKLFIEELQYWDAHVRGNSFMYFTTIPENAELVHSICHISGYSASITLDEDNSNKYGNTSTKPLYTVNVSRKKQNVLDSFRWNKTTFDGLVGCPSVPSTMWLVRYKGGIHITGNCNLQNLPQEGKLPLYYALQVLEELKESFEETNIDLEEIVVNSFEEEGEYA